MTGVIRFLSGAGVSLCISLSLAACAPEAPDEAAAAGPEPAEAAIATADEASATNDAVVEALPDACARLGADRAGALLGADVAADSAGSSPFRSVCSYETGTGDASRALTLVISSLKPAVLDYRGMSQDAFAAAVSSMIAPSYQDVELIEASDGPGNGSLLFDLEGAVALWVNAGIRHRVPMQQAANELFVLVRLSGFDDRRAAELVRDLAADVQDGLEVGP